ncbi:Discoidin, CUB and LCCL domain-containing protein 2, partial [Dryobates pubescens]
GDGCGHTLLTPHSGTLSSKNYPGTYPNNTACRWRLRAPPGTSLLLAFGDVDLEPSERCARSSLLLADPQAGTAYEQAPQSNLCHGFTGASWDADSTNPHGCPFPLP